MLTKKLSSQRDPHNSKRNSPGVRHEEEVAQRADEDGYSTLAYHASE